MTTHEHASSSAAAPDYLAVAVERIRAYCEAHGISLSAFGERAVRDPKFFQLLQARRVTTRRIDRALAFIDNNPAGVRESAEP